MRASLAVLLCVLLPATAAAEPCKKVHTIMDGKPAPCTGNLLPKPTAKDLTRKAKLLPICRADLKAERKDHGTTRRDLSFQLLQQTGRAEHCEANHRDNVTAPREGWDPAAVLGVGALVVLLAIGGGYLWATLGRD